jgi:predicted enzyme related to lactoylglutathione lyase
MKVLGVDNVLLGVPDLAHARRFYTDLLGLKVRFEVAEAGIILFAIGDEEPGLLVRAGDSRPPRLWLEVPDARAAAEELQSVGLTPLAPAFEVFTGWTVELADPAGNVVGLTDYVKQPSRARPH